MSSIYPICLLDASEFVAPKVLGVISLTEKENRERAAYEQRRREDEERRRAEMEANGEEVEQTVESPASNASAATARTSTPAVRKPDGRLLTASGRSLNYSNTLNDRLYSVENPDILVPLNPDNADRVLTFSANNMGAGYSMKSGKGHLTLLSVPIESIYDEAERDHIFKDFLK